MYEITLRNAISGTFQRIFGPDWPQNPRFRAILRPQADASIQKTITRLNEIGQPIVTDRIVAGLSFDFWVGSLTHDLEHQVWQRALHTTFPHLQRGRGARRLLLNNARAAKDFRNRVAHHEPIFKADHSKIQHDIVRGIGYRCQHTARWVAHHSRVGAILRQKP